MLAAVCFSSDYWRMGEPVDGNLFPTAHHNSMGYGPSVPQTKCIDCCHAAAKSSAPMIRGTYPENPSSHVVGGIEAIMRTELNSS